MEAYMKLVGEKVGYLVTLPYLMLNGFIYPYLLLVEFYHCLIALALPVIFICFSHFPYMVALPKT